MKVKTFDELLSKLENHLKHCSIYREIIPQVERLAVTLRFLATGNTYIDLHYHYRLGESTIGKIVTEVCTKIWDVLHDETLRLPSSHKDWLRIAAGFESRANFPNCVGAIDGKHVRIICPAFGGSLFSNYKKYYSIVLLAMCDANYCFKYINVGACGTDSDFIIFRDSNLYAKLQIGKINLPEPRQVANSWTPFPYIIVGDAAFGISRHILRPYARRYMTHKKKIFNYRLSRTRRYIESTFGIMSNKFEVFHWTSLINSIKIVKACCVLHNFIRVFDGYDVIDTMSIVGLENVSLNSYNIMNRTGDTLRDLFANYFVSPEGSLPWQNQYIY
ncbi:unnamed protein product [Parnassius mnemosyne]|uniref:DDE Tnp4 domain-containing protein n=1 Tax=Parnassius mnemosyne TaxID=213953 RepID=A0AAV1LER5_9NEOP